MARLRERSWRLARSRACRIARLIGWNALVLAVGLAFVAGGAEVSLRLTVPFRESVLPMRLAPGVGVIWAPRAEIRYTNGRDFRQVSRANRLGFLDREPPDPARAAESCHVTLIGDSYVDALEVPIAEKAQVRLEELAARELPALDVTTSAFGHRGTGQVNQLPFYDAWARSLSPDVVVLVFISNDFQNNSLPLTSWTYGRDPDYPPHLNVRRGAGGGMEFVPPVADLDELRANLLPRWPAPPESAGKRLERTLRGWSYLADWLWLRAGGERLDAERAPGLAQRRAWAEAISEHPRHGDFLEGWSLRDRRDHLLDENPPPVFREALDATRFALEQFRERARRDGAALVILAGHDLWLDGGSRVDLLRNLAAGVGIPVISQYDHIMDAGGELWEAHWAHDYHWNATGHRWAAETILEWLKRNPEVCD